MKAIVIDDDKLIHTLITKYAEKSKMVEIIGTYESATDALKDTKTLKNADIIFLDIEMPDFNGFDFLKTLDSLPFIIIISAKEKYAVDAFEFDVTDYLLKPIEYPRFIKALNRVKEEMEKIKKDDEGMFIKESSSTYIKLRYDEIYWIEALENYVIINTETAKHTIHFTMKALEKQLPDNIFARIHRSYIVNLRKIDALEDNYVVLKYKGKVKSLPVAKTYRESLMKKLNIVSR